MQDVKEDVQDSGLNNSGLVVDFDNDDEQITIDGNNPVFENTTLEGRKIKFIGVPVDGTIYDEINRKYTKLKRGGKERKDIQAIAEELFMRQIQAWEGLIDPKGNKIPCTPENKKAFAKGRHTFMLARLINAAFLESQFEAGEVKEEEAKN